MGDWTVEQVYEKLGLESPAQFAVKQALKAQSLPNDITNLPNDVIICERQTGRTTRLLAQIYVDASQGKYVVVKTLYLSNVRRLQDKFGAMLEKLGMDDGFYMPTFITYNNFNKVPIMGAYEYYEDNILGDLELLDYAREMRIT